MTSQLEEELRRRIAGTIETAIRDDVTPGAVVLVGRGDEVLCHEALGHRMVQPERRPMKLDTVFDVASLTKPVATAVSVLQLIEREELSLDTPVRAILPGFTGDGRESATVRHLLTHSAGLPAYRNYLDELGEDIPPAQRRRRVVEDVCSLPLEHAPGEGFLYSCLSYILLASVVEAVAETPLDELAAQSIFRPLGMADTCFNPPPELAARCAATEQLPDGVLCGVVHDEDARYLGGVGGNSGLFSTARDLSRFVRAILAGGELDGVRILSEGSVQLMISPQLEVGETRRGLGWDIASSYSPQVRGGFPPGGIGHSGYTGTSIWADPPSGVYVILLTNRVHLGRDREIGPLRREVATIAAEVLLPAQ
ncbi:MAG: serine hydrolase domain-containing protein [Armatimonadota bacterium]|nr:serine hydrolase domain-containing protein [Armatimonadota bacterium]